LVLEMVVSLRFQPVRSAPPPQVNQSGDLRSCARQNADAKRSAVIRGAVEMGRIRGQVKYDRSKGNCDVDLGTPNQNIAIGFTGPPVAPGTRKGLTVNK
jgi:hypothetical protein